MAKRRKRMIEFGRYQEFQTIDGETFYKVVGRGYKSVRFQRFQKKRGRKVPTGTLSAPAVFIDDVETAVLSEHKRVEDGKHVVIKQVAYADSSIIRIEKEEEDNGQTSEREVPELS
jgi:hypothetical protein